MKLYSPRRVVAMEESENDVRFLFVMSDSETYIRRAWDDRFEQPNVEQLRDGLPKDAANLFDRLRMHLLQIDGLQEEVAWYGPCWRWSVRYTAPSLAEPLAVIVPSPEDLQLAVPFQRDVANAMPANQFKRAIRDGLDLAREPFDTRWGVWSVQFANLLDDLIDLIDLKHKHICGNAKSKR